MNPSHALLKKTSTSFDVLVINANPLLNLIYGGEFKIGAINRVQTMPMVAEGKGVNVARVLALHGHRVALAGFAGGHSGAWLRDLVSDQGIEDAFTETVAPLRVGFMASKLNARHPTTVLPNGFPVTRDECKRLLERVEKRLGSVKLVIVSGSVPDPVADDLYTDLLALCAQHQVPCWMDAYGTAMKRALECPHPPALSKPNRQEFDQSHYWGRAEELHITNGDGPVKISSLHAGQWQVFPAKIKQVNPVGCGDCYLAGLAHGWLEDMPYEDCLRYAASAGAANALRQDVAMITPDEVKALMDKVRVERV